MAVEAGQRGEVVFLPRVLSLPETLGAIVGSVIGSGIFIVPGMVAREVGSIGGIASAWVLGGLFSIAGALTLAELAAMLPRAGGPYVYLRAAFGPLPAFLFGWTEFLVIRAGSVATLAAAFALYFGQLVPAPEGVAPAYWRMAAAVGAMAIVAAINVLGTKLSGRVQVVGTALKVGAIAAMMIGPFVLGEARLENLAPLWPATVDGRLARGMLAAMIGVLWAYDGWVNTASLAEEVRDPGRNVPRALMLGVAILVAIYLGLTLVYHSVLPMERVAAAATEKGSPRIVAADFCGALLGRPGVVAISLVVMASTFISLNGNALAGPRAYFAMARDGLFPRALGRVHPRYGTPAAAVIAQAVWSIALTVAGTVLTATPPPTAGLPRPLLSAWGVLHETPLYDLLYTYVIFGGAVFYALSIASVFVLRVRLPDLPRPYRAWGYPITPIFYLFSSFLLMGSMLYQSFAPSVAGLAIIAAGLPAYLYFRRSGRESGPRSEGDQAAH
ncbi:MAG TPA: amino acid permease [Isosphaeraceae bacterium]|jgi:amino acid transporter|nr:amino acid permease [Isosphaeraceae bacterium]